MTGKICTSITSSDFEECMRLVKANEMVELRLDLMQLPEEQVQQLVAMGTPAVVTCREGRYGQEERLQRLQSAIDAGARYVDVEIESEPEYAEVLVDYARQKDCKVIVSYHNFDYTPEHLDMVDIVDEAVGMGADVVKLITTATTPHDNARLLALYSTEENLVAFAMGQLGKFSRFACLYLGAPFTYAASAKGQEAAPGQLSVQDMQHVIRVIGEV